jgi:hypothetical protein
MAKELQLKDTIKDVFMEVNGDYDCAAAFMPLNIPEPNGKGVKINYRTCLDFR